MRTSAYKIYKIHTRGAYKVILFRRLAVLQLKTYTVVYTYVVMLLHIMHGLRTAVLTQATLYRP